MILEGKVSVKAAILAGNRTIEKLIISDDKHIVLVYVHDK